MSVQAPDGVALSAEDRVRMARLSEEVRGRLAEMAMIAARTLGITLDKDTVPVFDPTHHGESFARAEGEESVETVIADGPLKGRICYIDPPGICKVC